jgi:hypothetical protein
MLIEGRSRVAVDREDILISFVMSNVGGWRCGWVAGVSVG